MSASEHSTRARIETRGQHPLRHGADEVAFTHPSMPGVTNLYGAINWLSAVLYPNAQDDVATVGDLPASGNEINDWRVVLDDGDGRAAGYRWEQREGEASASWHKIADYDWSEDDILSGFYQKTLDLYVAKWGYNDLDAAGSPLTGDDAGQHVYGGKTANTHLTLHANSGDGVGAQTGYVQVDDHFRPTDDSLYTLGTTANRWLKVWTDELTVGTMTITGGSILDSSGDIDFGDEDLNTVGEVNAESFLAGAGLVNAPSWSFQGDLDSGAYLISAGVIGFAINGSRVASLKAGIWDLVAGTAAAPSLGFAGEDKGLYSAGTDILGFATNGLSRMLINADGDLIVDTDKVYVDISTGAVGVGTASPNSASKLHLYSTGLTTQRIEAVNSTAANAGTLLFARARATNANLAASDDLGVIDAWGMVSGAYSWLSAFQTRYRGDGTTRYADFIWSTANNGAPAERMRLRYDGNLGVGISDPTSTLHVTGDAQVDNLNLNGNTLSSTNVDGLINLAPNGAGYVTTSAKFLPTADGTLDLGGTGARWNSIWLDNGLTDGTNAITIAQLLAFRDASSGASPGMSLFYDGSKWVASVPDSEIDHGGLADLTSDDHSQYLLLAGRTTGQVVYGGTAAGADLTLESTSNASKGSIFIRSHLVPGTTDVWDLGESGVSFRNVYAMGQFFGLRLENQNTAGEPAAAAGTAGRLYWNTDTTSLMVDVGGSWTRASIEKVVIDDTTGWDGTATSVAYDVTGLCTDARNCQWMLRANGSSFEQLGVKITSTSATNVTVSVEIPLASGTYRLIGVG